MKNIIKYVISMLAAVSSILILMVGCVNSKENSTSETHETTITTEMPTEDIKTEPDSEYEDAAGTLEMAETKTDDLLTEEPVTAGAVTEELITETFHEHTWSGWVLSHAPTCSEVGIEKRICNCGEQENREVVALGHIEINDAAVEPTCTKNGLTQGKHCASCNLILEKQEIIASLGHTEVVDPAVEPTCIHSGVTEAIHCSKCNDILVKPISIAPLGHKNGDWVIGSPAKPGVDGIQYAECLVCGEKLSEIIPMLPYSKGLKYSSNGDGTCYVIGIGTCKDMDIIIPCVSPNGDVVTSIGDNAFDGCKMVFSIVIPENVKRIGNYAFYNCRDLTYIDIPSALTDVGDYAFYNCTYLATIEIPNSVLHIGKKAFEKCNSLLFNEYDNAKYIGNDDNPYLILVKANNYSITSCEIRETTKYIASFAFLDCAELISIKIEKNIISIGEGAFCYCNKLSSITIPYSVVNIGESAFRDCDSLIEVSIPNSVEYIGENAFYNCNNLRTVTIGDNHFSSAITSIGKNAFALCDKLVSVVIGNNVKTIQESAFYQCRKLTSVTISSKINSIGNGAFFNCNSLNDVWYGGTQTKWKTIIIKEKNDPLLAATIHYNYTS